MASASPIVRFALPLLGALGLSTAVLASACDDATDGTGGSTGATTTSTGSSTGSVMAADLGMNDITFIVPLPTGTEPVMLRASDPAGDGQAILPKALVDQVIDIPSNPSAIGDVYADLQLVAARFDLCDRATAEPCADGENARFRLVFQPITQGQAFDLGFHVFYEIPKTDIPVILTALRTLSTQLGLPKTSALQVNPKLGVDAGYTDALRSLLAARCTSDAIVRVTTMGQEFTAAALRWIFHGIEKSGGAFVEIQVTAGAGAVQEATLLGNSTYEVTPPIDSPAGFLLALDESAFAAASPTEQEGALNAILEADHPTKKVPNTVQCVACHVSTYILAERVKTTGIDPTKLPNFFATPYDTSVAASESATDNGILRGLGWRGDTLAISQRVANETAEVLQEIAARY